MLIKRRSNIDLPSSEITTENVYLNRRRFMQGVAALAGTSLLAAACRPPRPDPSALAADSKVDELGRIANTFEEITSYNNYYEFTTDKAEVANLAKGYKTSPWEVEVSGLVNNPGTFGMEDLLGRFDQEERIYRMRCVEGWSMVCLLYTSPSPRDS